MEAVILTLTFLRTAGIGYIPVKMLGDYKEYRRRQNLEYLKVIRRGTQKSYDNFL